VPKNDLRYQHKLLFPTQLLMSKIGFDERLLSGTIRKMSNR